MPILPSGFSGTVQFAYNGIGEKHPRAQRGLLSKPDLAEVRPYRADVDDRMVRLLERH